MAYFARAERPPCRFVSLLDSLTLIAKPIWSEFHCATGAESNRIKRHERFGPLTRAGPRKPSARMQQLWLGFSSLLLLLLLLLLPLSRLLRSHCVNFARLLSRHRRVSQPASRRVEPLISLHTHSLPFSSRPFPFGAPFRLFRLTHTIARMHSHRASLALPSPAGTQVPSAGRTRLALDRIGVGGWRRTFCATISRQTVGSQPTNKTLANGRRGGCWQEARVSYLRASLKLAGLRRRT